MVILDVLLSLLQAAHQAAAVQQYVRQEVQDLNAVQDLNLIVIMALIHFAVVL